LLSGGEDVDGDVVAVLNVQLSFGAVVLFDQHPVEESA
jgi:hypothetical protein